MQIVITLNTSAVQPPIAPYEAAARMLRELCARMMADEAIEPERLRITNNTGVHLATVALHVAAVEGAA